MGKNKLKKFAEMELLPNVVQLPYGALSDSDPQLKGCWGRDFFCNDNPIVLELGCGRGEYTVNLARRFPDKNFIGIDIKGARMWAGAKEAHLNGLKNVGFLRTNIELLSRFFAPEEVSELWITFPDPQMKKTRKRLTATNFLEMYTRFLAPDGIINLKTDSPFLFEYTSRLVDANGFKVICRTEDLYEDAPEGLRDILSIHTHYENQWLARGKKIKYLSFIPTGQTPYTEPEADDIPLDDYRSYGRNYPTSCNNPSTPNS